MKALSIILVVISFVLSAISMYVLGVNQTAEQAVKEFMLSEDFLNNYVDMREVIDFDATEHGLYLYTNDCNGYYWER